MGTGIGGRADAIVEHVIAARSELVAAGEVDWAGKAADRYAAGLQRSLAGLSALRRAAEETHRAALRHQAAVDAARLGT
jgi:hypothetical protein